MFTGVASYALPAAHQQVKLLVSRAREPSWRAVLCCACALVVLPQSPLTLVQKVKCLVASYPFWPDYSLLQCLADGANTNQTGQQPAAAAATAGQA